MASDVVKIENALTRTVELLLAGAQPDEIHELAKREGWSHKQADTKKLVRRAETEIEKFGQTGRQLAFGTAIGRLSALFAAALNIQDFKTCLAIQKELNRLHGL